MNIELASKLILDDFYTNYTATPYRLNGNAMAIDPSDGNKGKTLDQIGDFIDLNIFPLDTSRRELNAIDKGRWISGFIRVNAYDKQEAGDTSTNGVRVDEMLGVVDTLYSEKTIEDTNIKITFETSTSITRIGINEDYQRYEAFMQIPFIARLI
jgi:hypothetical protein